MARFMARLVLALILAASACAPEALAQIGPQYAPSGVTIPSTTISSAAVSAQFLNFIPGRPINIGFVATGFTGTCWVERKLDGVNWYTRAVGAAGSLTDMDTFSLSSATKTFFISLTETQALTPIRVDCGVANGSYSAGTLVVSPFQ